LDDSLGDAIQWTNRRGHPIQYQRDAAGRTRSKIYADGSHVDYVYDEVRDHLTSVTDASGTTLLKYEDAQHPDHLTRIVYPNGRYLAFQYDAAGRRKQLVDQDGFTVNYSYDAVGRLEKLTDSTGGLIVQYTYDSDGHLSRKDLGNGTYTTYEYTEAHQVAHLINYSAGGTVNSRFDYTYDNLGRVKTMATLDGQWSYSYDPVGELTHAVFASNDPTTIPNQDLQYFYDAAGNRTRTILNGVATDYAVNSLNEYTIVGGTRYDYDAEGNLLSKTDSSGTTSYTFDDDNRLVGATGPDGTWAYEYDAFGDRKAVSHNGQRTDYLLDLADSANIHGEYSTAGSLVAHYS
jgi:YD repeat-containing protein